MDKKRIDVTRPSMPPFEEYVNEIKSIWERKWLTNFGAIHNELAEKLEGFLDVPNISLFTNGHQAIYSALCLLGKPGGEVITTPFTFASTTHAIAQAGMTPVFCDVDPVTYTLDPSKIESLITEKTVAILPVHVYGNVCDTEAISAVAKKYGLPVIYDAAHAFGVKKNGKGIGNFGDVSLYSFHATKAYNSIEGGAAAYGDKELSAGFKRFINFGLVDGENVENTGTNAKMNEFSAAMGLCNLRHIGEVLEGRKRVCTIYKKILFECDPLFDEKTGVEPSLGIKMLPLQDNVESNYAYFPVLFGINENCKVTRDQVKDMLATENIHARRYFYPLTSEFDCYRGAKGAGETPVAESISRKVLSLPLYAELASEDAVMIAELIKAFLK